jgi:hypothetical protein
LKKELGGEKFFQTFFYLYLVLAGALSLPLVVFQNSMSAILPWLALWCLGMPWSYIIPNILDALEYLPSIYRLGNNSG